MTSQQRIGAVVAITLAAAAGAVLALRPRPAARRAEAPVTAPQTAPAPGALPRDPLAYVPASTRILAVADLDALRRAPVTRRWSATNPSSASARCQAAIAQRVHTVVLAVPRLPVDDFAFVASGDVTPADLEACAPGAEPVVREGVRLLVVRSLRGDAGAGGGTLVWTPSGVMLVGSRAMVDAMLERGFDAKRGVAAPLALEPLRRHLREGAAAWALALPSGDRAPADDALGSVTGGALSAAAADALTLDARLLCDDGAHARRVADALGRAREGALAELTAAPLRDLVLRARVEPDGATVRARATVDEASLAGVIEAATRVFAAVPY